MPYATKKQIAPLTAEEKKTIISRSVQQLSTSRNFKRARMKEIKENEDLYHNLISEKSVRNPYNECFPYMAGYVDHLRSKIDDDSTLSFTNRAESDLRKAQKIQGAYETESKSVRPDANWNLKHRLAKNNAIFAGVAIYKYYAEAPDGIYRSCLNVVSHYDFHCEPRGGMVIENHLFCGEDNIFKNPEDLKDDEHYDQTEVAKLIESAAKDSKDNGDQDSNRNNRLEALKQDPQSHNFVGQDTIKMVEWYTTFKGKRYYVFFNEASQIAIRICPITDIFKSGFFPYITWHTNEDSDVFWGKAPADDARMVARVINTFINQELYNRQKRNYGKIAYDAEMFPNVAQLLDWRPDGAVAVKTFGGQRNIQNGMVEFKVGDLNGTLDLVTWLDQFSGRQTGNTPSSQGAAENSKKVGVFKGEIAQTEQLIGIKNQSYRDALSRLGLLFKMGLDDNLSEPMAIEIMGEDGVEWDELSPDELETERDLTIEPVGGTDELQLKVISDQRKGAALPLVMSVNPQWKDRQILLAAGFDEEALKDAFSPDTFATKQLLAEAAEAEKAIVSGDEPPLNRGADSNYMQHIIDFANDKFPEQRPEAIAKMSAEERKEYTEDTDMFQKLMEFAIAHTDIAVKNESQKIKDIIRQKRMQMAVANATGQQDPNAPANNGQPVKSNVVARPAVAA